MRQFFEQPVWVRVLRGILLAAIVAGIAFYTPTPYVLHAPGPASEVRPLITIADAETFNSRGNFLLPTVLVEPASLMYCVYGWMDPDADLTAGTGAAQHAQSPGSGPGRQMQISQYLASRVALESLGYEVGGRCVGLRVLKILPGSPNNGTLLPGDVLTEADGQRLTSASKLHQITGESSLSTGLPVTFIRDGKSHEVELTLFEFNDHARIGVLMKPEFSDRKLPLEVTFQRDDTIGASGGLVFALEIYDQLTSNDLTQGRRVAATGVLEPDGSIQAVQGVKYKLVGADRAGANLFLIPRDNWDEVKNTPTRVKVVPVSNFQEALQALR